MEMLPGSASPVLSLMPQSQFIWRREEGKKTDKDNFQHLTTITSWKGEHRVVLAGVRFTLPGFTEKKKLNVGYSVSLSPGKWNKRASKKATLLV